jgi:hypothetical protein
MRNNKNRGRTTRRRRGARRVTNLRTAPFQSTLTNVKLQVPAAGVSVVKFSPKQLFPDLQVSGQSRQLQLRRFIIKFNPLTDLADKTPLVTVQLAIADMSTNTLVPATPVIPLSLTSPRTLVASTLSPHWIDSSDITKIIAALNISSTLPENSFWVDIISIARLATDTIGTSSLLLNADLVSPLTIDDDFPETLSVTSQIPIQQLQIPSNRRSR